MWQEISGKKGGDIILSLSSHNFVSSLSIIITLYPYALYTAQKERRENAEKVVEFADEINDLRKDNERLEKERVEAKIKQTNSDQIISDLKEEVSRLTNEKKTQTMQVAVLSEIVVSMLFPT